MRLVRFLILLLAIAVHFTPLSVCWWENAAVGASCHEHDDHADLSHGEPSQGDNAGCTGHAQSTDSCLCEQIKSSAHRAAEPSSIDLIAIGDWVMLTPLSPISIQPPTQSSPADDPPVPARSLPLLI